MMRPLKKIVLLLDLFVQNILLLAVIGSGVIGIYFYITGKAQDAFLIMAYGMLFLGFWQMASGLILSMGLNDKNRASYFVFSLLYLILHSVIFSIAADFFNESSTLFMSVVFLQFAIIPIIIAMLYEGYSIKYFLDQTKGIKTHDFKI